eukprot:TRINITY_DN3246_c3_g1_i1.p1 TRINITY_DN3246_c3_g1~~TRINITY_DN3246_c3_g1_i1.p1  ORF type:complete len:1703 (+),score=316.86 TRINITY_DN3246_c3_g1_i1:64-5109(+)
MSIPKTIDEEPSLAHAVGFMLDVYADWNFLGTWVDNRFEWDTYRDIGKLVRKVAGGLSKAVERREAVGVMLENRKEWLAIDFACALTDQLVVGLHRDWHAEKLAYILKDVDLKVVFCDSSESIELLASIPSNIHTVVTLDVPQDELSGVVSEFRLVSFKDFLSTPYVFDLLRDDDPQAPFTLMYSSGTTGTPKAIATPKSTWRKTNCNPGPLSSIASPFDRRTVSYLSLAHGADRGVCWFTAMSGGCTGFITYPEWSPGFFMQFQCLRPTFFLGMSCTWQDLYALYLKEYIPLADEHLQASLSSASHDTLSIWPSVRASFAKTRKGIELNNVVMNRMRAMLGNSLLIAVTGGGPTSPDVFSFITECLLEGNECRVIDSYGSTEFPGISSNGVVSSEVELKLLPVVKGGAMLYNPEAIPPQGEIVVRRKDGCLTSYWNRPDLEAWKDGWYHTGDVGMMGPAGLKIVDRVSNLEEVYWKGDSVWIEPSKLEETYLSGCEELSCVVVVADRNREGIALVVVATSLDTNQPSPTRGRPVPVPTSFRDAIISKLGVIAKESNFREYEYPIGVVIETSPWQQKEGLITISGKPNRPLIKSLYSNAIGLAYTAAEVACTSETEDEALLQECKVLKSALKASFTSGSHSQAQYHVAETTGCALPEYKKGSRKVDLKFIDKDGVEQKVDTARGRDWLLGKEKLSFSKVSELRSEVPLVPNAICDTKLTFNYCTDKISINVNSKEDKRQRRARIAAVLRCLPEKLRITDDTVTCEEDASEYYELEEDEKEKLNEQFEKVVQAGLHIRKHHVTWLKEEGVEYDKAAQGIQDVIKEMDKALLGTKVTEETCKQLMQWKQEVLQRREIVARVQQCDEALAAWDELDKEMITLRKLGDALDVDTRSLPVTWRLNIDWIVPPDTKESLQCMFGCGRMVYTEDLEKHSNNFSGPCNLEIGLAEDHSTTVGGDQSITCDVTGALIDAEALQTTTTGCEPLQYRTPRMHSLDSHIDRSVPYHELLMRIRATVKNPRLLSIIDKHPNEYWVRDKQHFFWMHKFVCIGKDIGLFDTPASLISRACNAFENRPVLGVSCRDITRLRTTPLWALPEAAGIEGVIHRNFRWLLYKDLWYIVSRVAAGLRKVLPEHSYVLIAGYNDLEWAVADFALAVAGMASVGLHTTYTTSRAAAVAKACDAKGLLVMKNLFDRRDDGWDVESLLAETSLQTVVTMDAPTVAVEGVACHSFIEWAADSNPPEVPEDMFKVHGPEWAGAHITSLLATSGSTGVPKLVAISSQSFTADIAGDIEEREALSKSLTISYIPLSHSSDRFKLWQHVVMGGRVAFCFYAAHHWLAHEHDKKDKVLEYSSPVTELFQQVRDVEPTSMSCPPNIWGGLFDTHKDSSLSLEEFGTSIFGPRIASLATGGSPTPGKHLEFAFELARKLCADLVDSYGCTECGAIMANGRMDGSKFEDVKVLLLRRPDLGFGDEESVRRGELAVMGPSVAVGYYKDEVRQRLAFVTVGEDGVLEHPLLPGVKQPRAQPGKWYITGDIVSQDPTGTFTLIDRASSISIVKGNPNPISSSLIEVALEDCPDIMQATVMTSPEVPYVKALIVIDGTEEAELGEDPEAKLLSKDEVQLLIDAAGEMRWSAVTRALKGSDIRFAKCHTRWTPANRLCSGELKKMRHVILSKYAVALKKI